MELREEVGEEMEAAETKKGGKKRVSPCSRLEETFR